MTGSSSSPGVPGRDEQGGLTGLLRLMAALAIALLAGIAVGLLGINAPTLFEDRTLQMNLPEQDAQLSLTPVIRVEGMGWLEPAAADCDVPDFVS